MDASIPFWQLRSLLFLFGFLFFSFQSNKKIHIIVSALGYQKSSFRYAFDFWNSGNFAWFDSFVDWDFDSN